MARKARKNTSRKKTGKKTATGQKPGLTFSKLDPCLLLGATHSKVAHKLGTDRKAALMSAHSISKVGLGIRSLADRMSVKAAREYIEEDLVSIMVESSDISDTQKKIKSLKGTYETITASIIKAKVQRSKLKSLASSRKIGYIEASTRLKPTCDKAHISTGLVINGEPAVPQTGSGVLIGIIDTGIDVKHPAFKYAGLSRIVNYLDQETGDHFSQSDIDSGNANNCVDSIGHGTHVAGIAAGNGNGSPSKIWRGVAPDADLAVIKTTFDTADIAVGIKHIFDIAEKRGQPCVVNLSLGGHFGAHDGSSIAERMIDDLSGDGRIVVVSAGNDGNEPIHAGTTLKAGLTPPDRWVADFRINAQVFATASGPVQAGLIRLQFWHQREDKVVISLRSPTGNLFRAPMNDKQEFDLDNIFVEASHQIHPYSQDQSTSFLIVTDPDQALLSGWSIIVEDTQPPGGVKVGSIHGWILNRDMGNFTTGSTSTHLVGMPGTSYSAVTVASFASRKQWPSQRPNSPGGIFEASAIKVNDISYFSSQGPTRDGQNKPDIAAPGQFLLAPLSAHASENEMPAFLRVPAKPYAALQGTSMSAPYVTGAIALLLEKDDRLNCAEIKRRLIKSAALDEFTKPCWNPRWGYGRLNVRRLLEIEPVN